MHLDAAGLATGGLIGTDPTAAFLGTFEVVLTPTSIDDAGATVKFEVFNKTAMGSALRPPKWGFGEFYKEWVEPMINLGAEIMTGVPNMKIQRFTWEEHLEFAKKKMEIEEKETASQ